MKTFIIIFFISFKASAFFCSAPFGMSNELSAVPVLYMVNDLNEIAGKGKMKITYAAKYQGKQNHNVEFEVLDAKFFGEDVSKFNNFGSIVTTKWSFFPVKLRLKSNIELFSVLRTDVHTDLKEIEVFALCATAVQEGN